MKSADSFTLQLKTKADLLYKYQEKAEVNVSKSHQQPADVSITCFLQVFDDLQKMLSVTTETVDESQRNSSRFPSSPVLQFAVGACVALATVGMGIYVL